MKEPEFQKLLQDYMKELQNPEGKKVEILSSRECIWCIYFLSARSMKNIFGKLRGKAAFRGVERYAYQGCIASHACPAFLCT